MNEFSDEVHVYLDVFVVLVMNYVFGELVDSMIIAPKSSWMLLLESKL
jgi:hypothetical protein